MEQAGASIKIDISGCGWAWTRFLRENLVKRYIDMHSILCLICSTVIESGNYLFFDCQLARDVWRNIGQWWNLVISAFNSVLDWKSWTSSLRLEKGESVFLEAVILTALWAIWSFQNGTMCGSVKPKKVLMWDSIVTHSYDWASNRSINCEINWVGWLPNPTGTIFVM